MNEFTSEGLPVLFIKDLPPVSNVSLKVTRPEIYFGELGSDYCFVKTRAQGIRLSPGRQGRLHQLRRARAEFPSKASGGGCFSRWLLAKRTSCFPRDIQPDSRLMIYRHVLDRAQRLTPFIHYDHDPYMVIADDGALFWMLDGYTTSDAYPYSEPAADGENYIRNSVKATINAYTGEVRFYISDPDDPFIQTYAQHFPGSLPSAGRHAQGPARPHPLSGGFLLHSGQHVRLVPHDRPARVL